MLGHLLFVSFSASGIVLVVLLFGVINGIDGWFISFSDALYFIHCMFELRNELTKEVK